MPDQLFVAMLLIHTLEEKVPTDSAAQAVDLCKRPRPVRAAIQFLVELEAAVKSLGKLVGFLELPHDSFQLVDEGVIELGDGQFQQVGLEKYSQFIDFSDLISPQHRYGDTAVMMALNQALVLELEQAGPDRHAADTKRLGDGVEVQSLARAEYALHDRFADEGLRHLFNRPERATHRFSDVAQCLCVLSRNFSVNRARHVPHAFVVALRLVCTAGSGMSYVSIAY